MCVRNKALIDSYTSLTQLILQQFMNMNVIWSSSSSSCVQFADKTIGEILTKDGKYNRFLSLVDVSVGVLYVLAQMNFIDQ